MTAASRRKLPRRTPERILEVSLALFNRFGEPNVSTTLISTELRISPGNLYYHYPSKDELVGALYDRYEAEMLRVLAAAEGIEHVEDAWFWVHALFECIWAHRFLYRDLNDLLSRNRRIEVRFQAVLAGKQAAVTRLLRGVAAPERTQALADEFDATATAMVVVLTHWLSFEYECAPRQALEPQGAGVALARGVYHVLSLLAPYLADAERGHLRRLARAYRAPEDAMVTA